MSSELAKDKPSLITRGLFAIHIVAILILGLSAIALGILVNQASTNPTSLTLTCYGKPVFEQTSTYLKWLLPVFPALSTVNHIVSVSTWKDYLLKLEVPENGPIIYRWVEYAASASVMVWVIAQLSGVQEIPLLVTLCLINVAMQACGYMIERTGDKLSGWTAVGYVLFIALFAVILPYFFGSLSVAKKEGVSVPGAVYSVVFLELVLFLAFGVVSTYFSKKQGSDVKQREIAYVCLSITAKTLLAWLVYGGCLNIPIGIN